MKSAFGGFFNSYSHTQAFYWGKKCSSSLTSDNSMQVCNMQSFNHNWKSPDPRQGLNLFFQRGLGRLLWSPWWSSVVVITFINTKALAPIEQLQKPDGQSPQRNPINTFLQLSKRLLHSSTYLHEQWLFVLSLYCFSIFDEFVIL